MRGPAVKPIVIAAGGTGGHFFPAEALASRLLSRGHRIVLMTDKRSGAAKSPVFAGGEIHVLPGAGVAGRGIRRGAAAIASLTRGTLQARGILTSLGAGAIVGFGGYPCVPPILAARTFRKHPAIILQEQNAVLGRANRMLSRAADILALGFEGTTRIPANVQAVVTGNPVRDAIARAAGQGYTPPSGAIELLVLGGSLGARVFSDIVPSAIASLPAEWHSRLRIAQQCRQEDFSRVRSAYAEQGIEAELATFFPDVAGKLLRAHLVIARSGASTCAELAAIGRPSVLVPLPGAIDDHQAANAASLSVAGAAQVIAQADFTSELLCQILQTHLQSAWLSGAAAAAARCARTHAADDLADLVERSLAQTEALS